MDNQAMSASDAWQSDEPAPDERMRRQETQATIRRTIDQLSPEWRATFVLRTHQEMSYQQIADEMGCSIGTVMSRLHRVRMALKEALHTDG